MKKTLIVITIIIVVLLAALFTVPLLFKSTLLEKTKSTVNKNVNAEVEFADLNLSLFRNFPKISIVIKDLIVTGKGDFSQDTLLVAQAMSLKAGLFSILGDDKSIEEIELTNPRLNLLVNELENANWDIVKEEETAPQEAGTFDLQLEEIIIRNAEVIYDDRAAKTLLRFENTDFDLEGEMYGTSAKLQADGNIERFSLNYDGSDYISNVSLETETLLDINYETMNIDIIENELLVNRLPLNVIGSVQAPGDTIIFDLGIKTAESGFENFLALVPPEYDKYLEDMQTSGSALLAGTFKGYYFEDSYPALNIHLDISDGNLRYADLPEEIKNITADATIQKPQGDWDLAVIKVNEAHAEIRNNPVDFSLTLKNLMSDVWFDGSFIGKVNLEHLKNALPLDSVNMSGMIDANLFVQGNYSAIENEQYENVKAEGVVMLDDYSFQSPDLTQVVYIPQGQLDFSPESINLSTFDMRVGQSNFNLKGNVSNYLNYYFGDGDLRGELQLNSPQVNLNELFRLQAETETETPQAEEDEALAFDVPEDIDITFRSSIQRAVFDQLPISGINGLITARSGKLVLNNLNMNMLDGQLKLSGSYQNTPQNQPLFNFDLNIVNFDIPLAYKSLSGVQNMLPVAGDSKGRFSSTMKLNGRLTEQLNLIAPTIDGSGVFQTERLEIVNSPVFTQLSNLLDKDKLRHVTIADFKAGFTIENGNLLIKPFTTRVAEQETTIAGSLNTENLIDLKMDFKVQRDAFGSDIQQILNVLPGQENIQMIPATVNILGPVKEPEVKIDLSEARKKITEEVKKSTGENLKNTLDKVGKGLKDIFK
ncbi:MAG: AsmA family protein [Prolixibacteraceae bacterium]